MGQGFGQIKDRFNAFGNDCFHTRDEPLRVGSAFVAGDRPSQRGHLRPAQEPDLVREAEEAPAGDMQFVNRTHRVSLHTSLAVRQQGGVPSPLTVSEDPAENAEVEQDALHILQQVETDRGQTHRTSVARLV